MCKAHSRLLGRRRLGKAAELYGRALLGQVSSLCGDRPFGGGNDDDGGGDGAGTGMRVGGRTRAVLTITPAYARGHSPDVGDPRCSRRDSLGGHERLLSTHP